MKCLDSFGKELGLPGLRFAECPRGGLRGTNLGLVLGKMVRYRLVDIEAYLSAHEVEPDYPLRELMGERGRFLDCQFPC